MTNKIPPSLNWLINKHARLSGQIVNIKKRLKKVQVLVDRLRVLENDLENIEKTLSLHEIKVDTSLIRAVRPRTLRLKFPRGFLMKFVVEYLVKHSKNRLVTKAEIIDALKKIHLEEYSTLPPHVNFSDAVSAALQNNRRAGRIVRYHDLVTSEIGLWRLAKYHNETK